MQHKRPRLMAKILAFVLAVSLVFPVSAFASVADLADDTRVPGKSLANTYPNLPVDWQVSLAEDTKDVTVRVPVSLTADEGSSTKASAAAEVYVDVDGAVVSPGVYRLKDGARVAQAIDAAGGLAPEADVTGLNRASKVVDGQKIHVPTVGEQQASIAEAGVVGGASASSGVSGATGLVNINTASAAELQTLSGIGPSMAQSIIDERTKNGAFASVDDLMRVSGIGEKKLAKIKDCICV